MTMRPRAIPIALILLAVTASAGWAQQPRCQNNLKQIGIAMHDSTMHMTWRVEAGRAVAGETRVPGPQRAEVCSDGARHSIAVDGLSNTIMVGEAPARLQGCPADVHETGMGEAMARSRQLPDGSLEVSVHSTTHRGCSATAVYRRPAIDGVNLRQIQEVSGARRQPDIRRVAPSTRAAFDDFWAGLPPARAAALERELISLQARAERGEDVGGDWARIQRGHPALVRLSAQLGRELYLAAHDDGPAADPDVDFIICVIVTQGSLHCFTH